MYGLKVRVRLVVRGRGSCRSVSRGTGGGRVGVRAGIEVRDVVDQPVILELLIKNQVSHSTMSKIYMCYYFYLFKTKRNT